MAKKKKQNIDLEEQRYGLFMSENSFNLDVMYGREYLNTDSPFRVKYYRVDVLKSNVDDLYGEAKPADKKFLPVVELAVMLDVEEGERKYFGEDGIAREDSGDMVFGIYLEELTEKGVDMNAGNYVSFNFSGEKERFFEITSADNVSDTTARSRGGFKPYWKKITATPVHEDVVGLMKNS